ncbi:MAG: squalene synthase HpnC [Acidobacteriota bacterium]|nr:squalene synthase HpnC [Acidobacteriota bacterium]
MARQHYENFPVASLLLPAPMRPHVAAVYAFARVADDFADEGSRPVEERYRLLDGWLARLHACVEGGAATAEPTPEDLIFLALGASIRTLRLPVGLFEDLLSAFRQDVETHRYRTWDDVLDYCRRSANPVGRLVLRIAGYDDEALDRSSDALCTALQLANFWQDFGRDWRAGRLYVPLDDCAACGAREADLDAGRLTPAWRDVLHLVAVRTRALFDQGRAVCDGVSGRLRLELRFTWLGGRRTLERVEASGYDVLDHRPALGAGDAPALLWRALRW